jgi:hypothetical protein
MTLLQRLPGYGRARRDRAVLRQRLLAVYFGNLKG